MNKESEEKADDNGESKKSKSEIDSTRDLAKLIPEEVRLILDDLPDEKRQVIIKSLVKVSFSSSSTSSTFSGPIPPPELLAGYNNVLTNGAERIVSMAEKQSNHRMQLENYIVKEELRQSEKGQNYGFVIAIAGLLLASGSAILGYETFAGIFVTTGIVGLVTVFVIGKKAQNQDIEDKK
jgi:uncharacterized membrane protein